MDDDVPSPPRLLKGYRRRWQTLAASPIESEPLAAAVTGDDQQSYSPGNSVYNDVAFGDALSVSDDRDAVEPVSASGEVFNSAETNKRPFESVLQSSSDDASVRLLDPRGSESAWRAAALEVDFKRMRSELIKLPWELEGTAFPLADKWHGTVLASFDKHFAVTNIGVRDVWHSQVVSSRSCSVADKRNLPVVPINPKRSRREPVDEDIRCRAMTRFKDLLLQDPLATQLGTSLRGRLCQGGHHDDIEQSFTDCFRLKASSTLQKRAASLNKLAKGLRDIG